MNKKALLSVGVLLISVALAVAGGARVDSSEREAGKTALDVSLQFEPRHVMDLICMGMPDSAVAYLESDEALLDDPFALSLKARAMRENISDEDDNKGLIKQDTAPIHEVLDRAIEICDEALEDSSDPRYYYVRGRLHLGKAQLYTFTRSFWGAGRQAAKSKKNLEKFLEYYPGQADASGDLGAFLYFADTLPGIIKFISKLLLIPSGDRERGLELLEYAASEENGGIFAVDYQIGMAAILLVFEGRFEEGAVRMQQLIDRFPYYTRLVEPFGVMAPMYPLRMREFQRTEDGVVLAHLTRNGDDADWRLIKRLKLHRAYSNMFFSSPRRALEELTEIVNDPPSRPDWVLPLALVNQGHLYAKMGRTEDAARVFERVLSDDSMGHFHDLSSGLLKSLDEPWKTVDLADLDFIESIYGGDIETARHGLAQYELKYGRDVLYNFYLGEIRLFEQRFDGAKAAYQVSLDIEVKGGDQSYQMFSALRLAELLGNDGRYKEAKEYIEHSVKYTHAGYLLDMLVLARKRYYELLADGTIETHPNMLVHRSISAGEPVRAFGK